MAMAALFVALVRALHEIHKSVPSRATTELMKIYNGMKSEFPSPPLGAMQTLRWAMEMLQEK